MPVSVSYKPLGDERGREVGRVLIIDPEVVASDPSTASAEAGSMTVMLTPAVGDSPGITDLGYKLLDDEPATAAAGR